jgi:hypothetical protein
MPDATDPKLSTSSVVQKIPRKTLEYFAATYTATPYSIIMDTPSERLVEKIKSCGMLSKIVEIYEDTVRSVEKEKDKYDYFIRHINNAGEIPISYSKVISALDESHLFGKAIFILLLNMGTMETASDVFLAVKKEREKMLS